ncbi:Tetratricopeptide repeat-containing protein [Reichenbachiella agariperforans]|uniref:Tetratricopeptide repeat-containing protein n=1 Tax=Reichenbachiella agariperforans TaxID=156994 RepID=A0A1M6KTQ0_REIAG|nr:tetratricopeptide repeat protein [Reichenbachiella agariperforans]SHJ62240.1 Tetratricopeptide repeat-containing protein [Reichenbachiella agariperforans]
MRTIIHTPHILFKGFIITLLLLTQVAAQAQELDQDARFRHAKLLYQKNAYVAARLEFAKITAKVYREDVDYFIASCAVRAGQDDGEYLIQKFVEDYPYNHYAKSAYVDLGNYYFDRGEYQEAIRSYEKNQNNTSPELMFKKGYAFFSTGENNKAMASFAQLDNSFTSYEKDAAYFQGYILYHGGKIKQSYEYLERGFESEEFGVSAFELYMSALYSTKQYKELIRMVDDRGTAKTSQMIVNFYADAHYALGKYNKASDEYTKLFNAYSRSRNEVNYYKAGYSNYKLGNTKLAEEQLKRSAVADDTVGAYASYYLGVLYLQTANIPFTITSFENTTKYDTRLKEDAYYQLTKALMQVPNYSRVIEVVDEYADQFPNGKYKDLSGEMLSMAYALTDNYDLAINYIESRDVLTTQMKRTYQRVSFLKAMSLFNDKKFELAIEVFKKSLIHNLDRSITQNAYYWTGESLAVLERDEEALFYYRSVTNDGSEIYKKSLYGKGYAYFNMKEYEDAKVSFEAFEKNYTKDLNAKYISDVYMRLGDCNFALKNYSKGITYYKQAEQAGDKRLGEIYFQIGLLNRYIDKDAEATRYFKKLIAEVPNSPKLDHAHFQIAKIEFEQGDMTEAIESYRKFMFKFPSSPHVPFALLDQAVAYDNKGNTASSITNYKEILDRFPRHETANSALLGLQQKSNQGEFKDFETYLSRYKSANPNSEALENIEFETAQAHYYNQQYTLAISGLQDFIKTYKKSSLVVTAKYLIADSYYRIDEYDKSLSQFYEIEQEKDFSKYSKVLHRIATIEAEKGNVVVSNVYFHEMMNASTSSKNMIQAATGLMENFYRVDQYDSAIYYGTALLSNARTSVLVEANANLIVGKSQYHLENYEDALVYLLPLVGNSPDERGAEAYLYISKIYYLYQDYEKALESLFILTNNFKNYEYWQSEAFLLMADIYIDTDEVFQAKATLNSLITHSTIDEIKFRAESKLKKISEENNENN